MLAQLLANEKANTARLRTDLVSNLTNLVVNFTEAHDDSWSAAVAQMQSANAEGMNGIEAFGAAAEVDYEHSSARVAGFGGKLVMAQSSGVKQREAGQMVSEGGWYWAGANPDRCWNMSLVGCDRNWKRMGERR